MHTVSLFPHLFDYQLLGVFALRVTLGFLFIYSAYAHLFGKRIGRIEFFETVRLHPAKIFFFLTTITELVIGVSLVVGIYTQLVSAVAGTAMLGTLLFKKYRKTSITHQHLDLYILITIVSFSLIVLGPGIFAVDLPL